MSSFRGIGFLVLLALLCSTTSVAAQAWENDRYHLSMQNPTEWVPMNDALLAQTNASVSHVTGRGFIAGYALRDTNTLVFPYMLVQFKPYSTLPEPYQPLAKLDERGKLELLWAMVGAFRQGGELPNDIDFPQFNNRFGNDRARLNRLEDDGRFDFAGKIPHEQGYDPIRYHTHGVFGKDGIAMVSIFSIDDFSSFNELIQNEMRTLTFKTGFGMDALPDEPPTPEPNAEQPGPTEIRTEQATGDASTSEPTAESPADSLDIKNPSSTGHANSNALVMILSLLGVALVAIIFIVWFVTHKKAQAQRERRRARRERILAAQAGSASVNHQPRPAAPPTAKSPGSTDRRKPGRIRS